MENDRIEKHIDIEAPRTRVWRALTDHREFGAWFRVVLEAPFVAGQTVKGRITVPGFEHVQFAAQVERIEPESYFSYRWHPFAVDPQVDYSLEPPTLVEFTLVDTAKGTRLTVVESGFAQVPAARRAEAFRMNSGGWASQVENIRKHVEK